MSSPSPVPLAGDIEVISEDYDTSNPVIAEIFKAKAERLKILEEFNKQHQEEWDSTELLLKDDVKKEKKSGVRKSKKSETDNSFLFVRRSTRLQNSPVVNGNQFLKSEPPKCPIVRPANKYGAIPGVEVGTHWETRMECSQYGVHRPTVAGIHGGPGGAYSIALSGGYPEDVDEGDSFIYTGAGGRDLKGTVTKPKNLRTAPQTRDQQLEGTNLSLVKSIESRLPVRVIRGYKSPSIFAPESGYRYDGLYQVIDYWQDVGKTGHKIYRFKMERMRDQAPAPWEANYVPPPDRKAAVHTNENFEYEVSLNDESEFKENIAPDCCDSFTRNHNVDCNVQEVDDEIEKCVVFLSKTSSFEYSEELTKDCTDEEFSGWD